MSLNSTKLKNGLYIYSDSSEQPSIVPWLLGSFSSLTGNKSVLEMCAGSGAASFWCIDRGLRGNVVLLDKRENALDIAKKTIEMNNLNNVECVCIPLEDYQTFHKYDAVLCNPPFFSEISISKNEDQRAIRHEGQLTLEVLCESVSKTIKQKGHFYLCHTPSRLTDIILALNKSRFEIKRIRFCRHMVNNMPFLVLIDSVFLGGKGVSVLPDLIVMDESGSYSEEMKSICERYDL